MSGPPSTSETDYARRLLHLLNPQMLARCGRGFDGETCLTELAGTGAQFLVRLCATRRLPILARLDDRSYLSRIGTARIRIIAADMTNNTDLVGHIGRAVLADLLPSRRPHTSVRKVKSPLSRYHKKDPYRPELTRSTPITSITATTN